MKNLETKTSHIFIQIANIARIGFLGYTLDNPNNKSCSVVELRSRIDTTPGSFKRKLKKKKGSEDKP